MKEERALERAVRLLGSQAAVAKACGDGVRQQTVWWWLNKADGRVPPQYAVRIERAIAALGIVETVSKEALCPDFPWEEIGA